MNKAELIEKIASATEIGKANANRVLDIVTSSIVAAVAAGDTVTLVGFGAFKTSQRAARTGINPRTKESIKIAARTMPKFKAGKEFRDACNATKKGKKK
jgi:DNA-binding protein HU-beta